MYVKIYGFAVTVVLKLYRLKNPSISVDPYRSISAEKKIKKSMHFLQNFKKSKLPFKAPRLISRVVSETLDIRVFFRII